MCRDVKTTGPAGARRRLPPGRARLAAACCIVEGMTAHRGWLIGGAAYVVVIGGLAVTGGLTRTAQPYLAALVLTLPLGVPALLGVYGGYALMEGIGGLFAATTVNGGGEPHWLSIASAALNVVLFMAAAAGNVLLARNFCRARRRSRSASVPVSGRSRG